MPNGAIEPRSLGRYELLFMLGQGGMGEVHLAKLTGTAGFEKLCIVKTILPQMKADSQFVDRFHHEARVLVQLNHSNIAQVYDMGEVDGTLYMAIEYVPGVDLSRIETRIEGSQTYMPIPVALALAKSMCEALGYAHRKTGADGAPLGIVHRDVSPQNVMVSYEGEVKVIDFGLAKSAGRSKHTMPQTVMGKLGYMSPEQALAKPVDSRSDIFSAGIVVWEMLAGRPLYAGGTMAEMLARMAAAEVPALSSIRSDVSPTLEQIVMRALAKEPAARYARCDEFARALNELAVREGLMTGSEEIGNYVRAMCPTEFAAERQLQSQLSVLRRKTSNSSITSTGSEPTFQEGMHGDTRIRSGSAPVEAANLTPAQRALSVAMVAAMATPVPSGPQQHVPTQYKQVSQPVTDQSGAMEASGPIVVPRNRAPMIVLAVGAVLLLGAAAAAFVMSRRETPPPVLPGAVVDVKQPSPEVVKPAVDPEMKPSADVVKTSEPAAPREKISAGDQVFSVATKNGNAFIILQRGQVLGAGDRLKLLGEEDENKKREVLGNGAVMTLNGSIAELIVESDEELPARYFAVKDANPKPLRAAPVAKPLNPQPTVVAKPEEPARPGTKLNDPEPTPAVPEKKDPPVAVAPAPTPVPVANVPNPALNPPVAVAQPTKTLPVAAPIATPTPTPAPAPTAKAADPLTGSIQISEGILGKFVRVQLTSNYMVSGCIVRLTNGRSYHFGAGERIAAKDKIDISFNSFRIDNDPADPNFAQGWSSVRCREGTGYLFTRYLGR